MPLPECHSRHELREGSTTYFCAHPTMHSRDNLVSSGVCRVCDLWKEPSPDDPLPFIPPPAQQATGRCYYLGECTGERECPNCGGNVRLKTYACRHPHHGEITLKDCLHCGDYEPRLKKGEVGNWAIGVVGQDKAQVQQCIARLHQAGWDDAEVLSNAKCAGACKRACGQSGGDGAETPAYWPQWFVMLARLLVEQATADAFMIVPAEFQAGEGLRDVLDNQLWPADTTGAVVIDACGDVACHHNDIAFEVKTVGRCPPDALALVMPSAAVRHLFSYVAATNHRRWSTNQTRLQVGDVLSQWSRNTRIATLNEYVHSGI